MEGLKLKEISSTDSSNGVLGCLAGSVASSVTVLSRANLHQNSALNGIPDIDSQDREVDSGISDAYAEITTIQKIQAETITKIYQTYWLFFTFFLIWAVCATAFCHYLENKNDTIQDDDSDEENNTTQDDKSDKKDHSSEVTTSPNTQINGNIIPSGSNSASSDNNTLDSEEVGNQTGEQKLKDGNGKGESEKKKGVQKEKKKGFVRSFFKIFSKKNDKEDDKEDVKEDVKEDDKKDQVMLS